MATLPRAGCLALASFVGSSSVGAVQSHQATGPAAVESRLLERLEEAFVRSEKEQEALAALAPPGSVDASRPPHADLERCLRLASQALRGTALPVPALPADTGLLFLLARRLPLPLPPLWLAPIADQLGTEPRRDLALLELLVKAPPSVVRPILQQVARRGQQQELDRRVFAASLHKLGMVLDLGGADGLADLRRSPDPLVRFHATAALGNVMTRQRPDFPDAVGAWYLERARRSPRENLAPLQAASALLAEARPLEPAISLLEPIVRNAGRDRDTGQLEGRSLALLARAWDAFLQNQTEQEWSERLREAGAFPREILGDERRLEVVRLRASLVGALLRVLRGAAPQAEFQAVLELAPVDAEANLLDVAFFGPLGPYSMFRTLRRQGHAPALLAALHGLVEVIEASTDWTGYGLLQRDRDQEEWRVSWIFLHWARLTLEDGGDVLAAQEILAPRRQALKELLLTQNLRLLVECDLLLARTRLFQRDAVGVASALTAAFKVVRGLQEDRQEFYLRELDRDEVPVPPVETLLWSKHDYDTAQLARIRLLRANLHATLEADPQAAALAIWQAGAHLPWDQERWMTTALDLARRGFRNSAARALACVETAPSRLYDRACVLGFLGRTDLAIEVLHEYLERFQYTSPGRTQEVRYMRLDPDLRTLWARPDFPCE